jgi:hypothetical protein
LIIKEIASNKYIKFIYRYTVVQPTLFMFRGKTLFKNLLKS